MATNEIEETAMSFAETLTGTNNACSPPPVFNAVFDVTTLDGASGVSYALKVHATDAQIKELGESGRICEVYGHVWRDGTVGQSEWDAALDRHRGIKNRFCHICGKPESMSTEWK